MKDTTYYTMWFEKFVFGSSILLSEELIIKQNANIAVEKIKDFVFALEELMMVVGRAGANYSCECSFVYSCQFKLSLQTSTSMTSKLGEEGCDKNQDQMTKPEASQSGGLGIETVDVLCHLSAVCWHESAVC